MTHALILCLNPAARDANNPYGWRHIDANGAVIPGWFTNRVRYAVEQHGATGIMWHAPVVQYQHPIRDARFDTLAALRTDFYRALELANNLGVRVSVYMGGMVPDGTVSSRPADPYSIDDWEQFTEFMDSLSGSRDVRGFAFDYSSDRVNRPFHERLSRWMARRSMTHWYEAIPVDAAKQPVWSAERPLNAMALDQYVPTRWDNGPWKIKDWRVPSGCAGVIYDMNSGNLTAEQWATLVAHGWQRGVVVGREANPVEA